MSWGFYASPMMYAQNALVLDEFLDKRWSRDHRRYRYGSEKHFTAQQFSFGCSEYGKKRNGLKENRMQFPEMLVVLLVLDTTALIVVRWCWKENLMMDVLAGRKTGGYTEGNIFISGYPKNQSTFARVSGYCEQNDIHSPNVTVYESLLYSAWLRLSSEVNTKIRKIFVDELMELVELHPLRNAMVGLPGVGGLTIEQRKRLTIAVELVANPSIIFMDEPTSGLDARAAAIVMRTVRNTVDTGRTLLLMKIGGQIIFAGPLGHQSHKLVEYFQDIPGVPKIRKGHNPATWVLDVTSSSAETQLNVDYAQIYANSTLYEDNQELIRELSAPPSGSKDLFFKPSTHNHLSYNARLVCGNNIGHIGRTRNIMSFDSSPPQQLQDLLDLSGGLYAVVLFLGAVNINTVQPIVAVERTVFYRERAAGMYSSLPYALSQVTIESIYIAIQTSIYALILYPTMGFEWIASKFLWFYYFLFMSFISFTLFGMMTVALTPTIQISAILIYFFTCLWNLFSGFVIPRPPPPLSHP
ncbi:ARID DNA-binding domain-containing protein [Artemisia annua]|uniref:ARID DNA-binding domain-containing protein n=1 Tax=Artemisia annua TaxID=35608 RepID=A0A2U1KPZ1_ARTAN|nr:ARID DNA-binding domain-containing protein [Artemisia annua]